MSLEFRPPPSIDRELKRLRHKVVALDINLQKLKKSQQRAEMDVWEALDALRKEVTK